MLNKIKILYTNLVAQTDRLEFEQAIIRLGIGLAILLLLIFRIATHTAFTNNDLVAQKIISIFLLISLLLIGLILHGRNKSKFRRLAGAWLDQGSTSLFIALSSEAGILLVGIYLWVIFGNGFRFGRKYLFHAQALSLIGFLFATQMNPYWQQNSTITYGVMLMLIALPIYVSALIRRMDEARQKAEEASAAKTRFVANMSHEIRTPLNGIVGINTLFKATPFNAEQQDLLKTLESSSKLLLALLNNVLDFAKIEEGKLSVENTPLSIENLLDDTLQIFQLQAHAKNIRFETQLISAPGSLRGDPHLLQQVLANLVGNAVKFTAQGSVNLTFSILEEDAQHSRIRFEVADTGVGIPSSAQGRIFESFIQADISTTRQFGGSGLGLTITKYLVEAMGGSLSFESAEGLGSRFWFDLDLEKTASTTPATYTVQPIAKQNDAALLYTLDILVCEDDATNQKILLRLLELAGHRIALAANGEEFLDQLEHEQFDLVIADLNMAGMSGADVLKLYRFTRPDDTRTRFILFTADATPSARQVAKEAGFDAFLSKPVDAPTLFRTIADLLGMPATTAENWLATLMQGANTALPDSAENQTSSLLDATTLRELEILGASDSQFVQRLLNNYLRDADAQLEQIEYAIKNRQYGVLHDLCHALKGNSLSVGARVVFTRAETIDRANPGELRFRGVAMVGLLRVDYVATRADIETYLSRRQFAAL